MRAASEPFTAAPIDGALPTGGYLKCNRTHALRVIRQAAVIALQLLGLWSINIAGVLGVRALALPIPGNLAGMILLYGLLSLGVVKIAWFDVTGSFLVRHLAFFFIPVAVGVIDAGALLANDGVAIALTLLASAAIGMALSGVVAQTLAGTKPQLGELR